MTIIAAFVVGLLFSSPGPVQSGAEVLSNESIINMTSANVDKDLLLLKINTTHNAFDVSVSGLVTLYQGRVNQDVMIAMMSAAANPKLGPAAAKTPEILDNQAVITMVTAKLPRAVVVSKIQNTKANFDVSSNGLVNLTQAKVPSDVVKAMIAKAGSSQKTPAPSTRTPLL